MAATDLERLVVQLSADVRGYENAMRRAMGVTNTQARAIENRYRAMGNVLNNSLSAPLAGIGAALSTREIMRYADAWTQAGNMIRSSAESAGVQTRSLSELRKGADEARTSLESYTDLYARLIRNASGVAKSEEEVALATSLVAKAMKAGGAATSEQQSAILQLGQALGSGVLQGDELRSLRENAPVLAQAIATEFGVTIAGLKKLGEEGELTSDRVFKAIIAAQAPIEAQFAQTNATISDGFAALRNGLIEYIGAAAEGSGATAMLSQLLIALGGNIEVVSAGAQAAAAALVILSSYGPALLRAGAAGAVLLATNPFVIIAATAAAAAVAVSVFGDEIQPIQGELANLQDYAGATWDAIVDGAGTAATAASDMFIGAINLITDAMDGISVAWADVGAFLQDSANTTIGIFVALYESVKVTFEKMPEAVASAVIGAINEVIHAVEFMINFVLGGVRTAAAALSSLPGMGTVEIIGPVDLGEIENTYAGAGAAAGDAYGAAIDKALSTDFLGNAIKPLRDAANLNAFKRKISAAIGEDPIPTTGFGGGSPTVPDDGGAGGKGKKSRRNELERETDQILKRTAALQAETAAQAGVNPLIEDYEYAVSKAKAAQDLLTAAHEAGIAVTPELRAGIDGLAEGYAQAVVASNQLQESQSRIRDQAEEMLQLQENTTGGLIKDLLEGVSAAEAFANALGKVGDKLIDMALSAAFDPKGGIFGGGGNIFSAISGFFTRRAAGGPVRAGQPYIVGEKKPELFVPDQNGTIIPSVPKPSSGGRAAQAESVHVTVGVSADSNGNLLPFVQSVTKSGMNAVRKDVPKIMANSQRRG